jgi:hypothetical protein
MKKLSCRDFGSWLAGLAFLAVLTACSEPVKTKPDKASEPAPPPEPVTARFAFQRMYIQATSWAADARPLRVSNLNLKEVASKEGRCPAWRAVFVSAHLRKLRTYTFSVIDSPGSAYEGVLPGREESWSGSSGQAIPFLYQAWRIDSDEAYQTAAKESVRYLKKNPEQAVQFLLEFTPRFPNPAWHVLWGETIGSSDYSVFVDCSTGRYLQTLH